MNLAETDSEDELPPGWEERVTDDGNVFYANHVNKHTQWTHPRTGKKKIVTGELPVGWDRRVDDAGKIFFVDHESRRTTYTDPRLAFAHEEKEHVDDYRQRFDASSTALQVLHGRDLAGRTAVVTGANTGIGYETARSLARHGCTVVLACRDLKASQRAVERIHAEKPTAICECVHLDLASLESVSRCAADLRVLLSKLDFLILNAAVFGLPHTKTVDGYETTFQVNHLGHFHLTNKLEPLLVAGSRIVVVSSESHRFATLTSENVSPATLSPDTASTYWHMTAYNNSKLCNVLHARLLAARLQHRGVAALSLHPGNMVSSSLSRHWWMYRLLFALVRPFTKSLEQAASTTVFCATARELHGVTGAYFNNCCRCRESEPAQDNVLAEALWDISEKMVQNVLGRSAFDVS